MFVQGNVDDLDRLTEHRAAATLLAMVEGDPETHGPHGQLAAAIFCSSAWLPGRERTKTDNVAPITDPSWMPLFVPAAAVVVDVGAALSHAIIVSRELGIPCVVSATDATRRIPDGALVRVDGGTGTVTVLDGA